MKGSPAVLLARSLAVSDLRVCWRTAYAYFVDGWCSSDHQSPLIHRRHLFLMMRRAPTILSSDAKNLTKPTLPRNQRKLLASAGCDGVSAAVQCVEQPDVELQCGRPLLSKVAHCCFVQKACALFSLIAFFACAHVHVCACACACACVCACVLTCAHNHG